MQVYKNTEVEDEWMETQTRLDQKQDTVEVGMYKVYFKALTSYKTKVDAETNKFFAEKPPERSDQNMQRESLAEPLSLLMHRFSPFVWRLRRFKNTAAEFKLKFEIKPEYEIVLKDMRDDLRIVAKAIGTENYNLVDGGCSVVP